MRGFSPRNLKYMRAFAAAWPDRKIVQEALAQFTCTQEIAFLEKVDEESVRLWQWSSPKKRKAPGNPRASRRPARQRGTRTCGSVMGLQVWFSVGTGLHQVIARFTGQTPFVGRAAQRSGA